MNTYSCQYFGDTANAAFSARDLRRACASAEGDFSASSPRSNNTDNAMIADTVLSVSVFVLSALRLTGIIGLVDIIVNVIIIIGAKFHIYPKGNLIAEA